MHGASGEACARVCAAVCTRNVRENVFIGFACAVAAKFIINKMAIRELNLISGQCFVRARGNE